MASENAELRRLCLYLDAQRQQAVDEVNRLKQARPPQANCWYSDPCCSSNCEYRQCCPMDPAAAQNHKADSPPHPPNDEILAYIRALEDRIAHLEEQRSGEGRAEGRSADVWLRSDGIQSNFVKMRRPVRSVSQQASLSSSTPELPAQPFQPMIISNDTLTTSGTTYGSSELDDEEEEDEEEDSTATTVYVAAKKTAGEAKNSQEGALEFGEKTRAGLVRKFLHTRERFLQNIKKRSELPPATPPHSNGYAQIQRPTVRIGDEAVDWSEGDDLPPKMAVPRIFTAGFQRDERPPTRHAA
ncbi:Protein of unknown function DUF2216 domain containing protein [Aphelenchoides fujianensis]|nr:Protein of unknown function DUF2216 domain containing protein [Aphelenchoides fujianensis]